MARLAGRSAEGHGPWGRAGERASGGRRVQGPRPGSRPPSPPSRVSPTRDIAGVPAPADRPAEAGPLHGRAPPAAPAAPVQPRVVGQVGPWTSPGRAPRPRRRPPPTAMDTAPPAALERGLRGAPGPGPGPPPSRAPADARTGRRRRSARTEEGPRRSALIPKSPYTSPPASTFPPFVARWNNETGSGLWRPSPTRWLGPK